MDKRMVPERFWELIVLVIHLFVYFHVVNSYLVFRIVLVPVLNEEQRDRDTFTQKPTAKP